MNGVYCIFDTEPNKEFNFGILKMSWMICKYENDNLITLSTTEYIIQQDDQKFKNYNYKHHGISNKNIKLEGESLFFILDQFIQDLKTFDVDFICGFKMIDNDLKYLYDIAKKYNITNLTKEYIEKKFIILDIFTYVGQYLNNLGHKLPLTFESLYPFLFKTKYPKTKFHNTSIECEHIRNILYKLLVSDPDLFKGIQPLIKEKIDFRQVDEWKDLVDKQLYEENEHFRTQINKLKITILDLECKLENKDDTINDYIKLEQDNEKYMSLYHLSNHELKFIKKEYEELKNELKRIYDNENQINILKNKNEKLEEELNEKNRKNNIEDFSKLVNEKSNLTKELDISYKQIEQYKKLLQENDNKYKLLLNNNKNLLENSKSLKNDLKNKYDEKLSKLKEENENLKEELSEKNIIFDREIQKMNILVNDEEQNKEKLHQLLTEEKTKFEKHKLISKKIIDDLKNQIKQKKIIHMNL